MALLSTKCNPRSALIVAEYGILNGGERSFLSVAAKLIRFGWTLTALLPPESEFDSALQSLGIETLPLTKLDADGNRLSQDAMRDQIRQQIESTSPVLVHCNSLSTSRWCGPVCRELGIPSLGYLRDIIKLSRKAIADINELDIIIAVSNATRDFHVDHGMNPEKIEVIHNGVDSDQFFPRSLNNDSLTVKSKYIRHELNISLESPLLLFVGQIGRRKGVDILLDAFETISLQFPPCHLLIVGERNSQKQEAVEYEQSLLARSDVPPSADRVHWLGRRNDVADLMRESDLLIHPARQEPLGRVLLEATASGLPMVTTRVGGSLEILKPLEEFELVVDVDKSSVASRVIKLLDSPNERDLISQRLRRMAISRFSVARCANEIHQRYCLLAKNNGRLD
jgi:glycosyltransferase involved in cell wall biosynthesis